MNITKSRLFLSGLLLAIAATILGIMNVASANPLRFPNTLRSATATSTVNYMAAGVGTTTSPTLDAFAQSSTSSGQPSAFAHDYATLFVQMGASSTVSALRINIEYSHDNMDWYEDTGSYYSGYATTTKPFDVGQVAQFHLGFASSTPGRVATEGDATTTRAIKIATPTRYVRAIFSVPAGAEGANVWSEWVPIKQTSE